ncbi:MOSC domain-containing protein [Polynucleobacter rarus]|uniref:MOSC domain-containing protein n=1 Tax=Polynucleobacter rarus TaxID=556055 RepID=UPI000D3E9C44|nr:MOSC domain-containing protein [Polynucleobacter rarus]
MENKPYIHRIYICPNAGLPMKPLERVKVLEGIGIEGDRYALRLGAFSKSNPPKIRDITLITKMGIDTANHYLKLNGLLEFDISETRRNIVIENLLPDELNALVGKVFFLGRLKFKGVELCDPCERPSKLANKKSFQIAYENNGGIRAQIMDDGEIAIGDILETL